MKAGSRQTSAAAEEQGRDSRLLAALLDVSGLLVVMLDEAGRVRLFNRACEELSGFSADEVLGRPIWSTLIPEDELPEVQMVHGRLRDGEQNNVFVNHWRTRSGERRLVQWRNVVLHDDDGQVLGYVGTGIDLTDRERAFKSRLHELHEHHYLLDALPMLIAHIAPDFRVRFANDGYRQWFGVDPADMPGRHVAEFIGDAAFAVLQPRFREALSGHRSIHHGQLHYLHGPPRFVHGTYIPAFDEDERIDGFYIVSVDLTEQHELREKLEKERELAWQDAQAHLLELTHATRVSALSEVTTGLAHEISQPLTAISASAEACLMSLADDSGSAASLRPALEKIAVQGQRARQIVEQLRAFLRKERIDEHIDCDPEELVDHVLLLLKPELDAAGIEVEKHMDPAVNSLRVNRIQIEQVLFNLVRNAIESLAASDGVRKICIRCDADSRPSHASWEVKDSGPGLSQSDLPRLFHPFYTTKREGLGQGLSICRSILDRHGGAIQGHNHPEGGAVFSFSLPLEGAGHD